MRAADFKQDVMKTTLVQLKLAGRTKPESAALDFTPLPAGCTFKVLLVYPNLQRVHTPQLGIASLSACIKRIGGQARLFDITGLEPGGEVAAFGRALDAFAPDLVAISVRSNEWPLTKELIAIAHRRVIRVVVGGPHATHAPDEAIENADIVCLGEGEGAMMDLVRALATESDFTSIANLWCHAGDAIIKNPKRDLIANLDDVPFPDWQLFDDRHIYDAYLKSLVPGTQVVAAIEGSRGCPFTCTYCSNERLMRDYKGQGTWRREKSPERMVAELAAFRETFGRLDFVYWVDEIWMTKTQRLAAFRDLYKAQIAVPFSIMERPECITEEKVAIMADAGLHTVAIGLESGDEELRTRLLDRRTDYETLVRAFRLPKRYGVRVHAFTMLGLPGQDEASMLETWRFMRRIKPTTAQFSIFYPLKGTKLYDQTIAMGLYDPTRDMTDYYSGSPLAQDDIVTDAVIRKYQMLMTRYATQPGWWAVVKFHLSRKSNLCLRFFDALMRARMRLGHVRRVLTDFAARMIRTATHTERQLAVGNPDHHA
jgi:anaerobic magnesium-protoporphyrin IX monomethyl ester cyclase